MSQKTSHNPLLRPILDSFDVTRRRNTGLVPRNWLLIILLLLDAIRKSDKALKEDDVYSYHFALKKSRAGAIPRLLREYELPVNLGMSKEGVTVRGAPGLRVFRAIKGGAVIMNLPKAKREQRLQEAVALVREELLKVVGQRPVELPSHVFEQAGTFIEGLLEAVENRSAGRVEQALVGAKLQLRFPGTDIPLHASFAGDRQTGREADYEVDNIRVIVTVSPKDQHFEAAGWLAQEGRQVYLVVSESTLGKAKKRIRSDGLAGKVTVASVLDYVTGNLKEVAHDRGLSAAEMCQHLFREYNRRIKRDFDPSLRVMKP